MEIKTSELGRGEIFVANFIPPCQFAIGGSLKMHIRNKKNVLLPCRGSLSNVTSSWCILTQHVFLTTVASVSIKYN